MQLLCDPDDEIEQDDRDEQQIRPCTDQRQCNGDQKVQQVEQRADVLLEDLPVRLGSRRRQCVLQPFGNAFLYLLLT